MPTEGDRMSAGRELVRTGISMGSALAMIISWSKSASVLWAIFHGILSWLYVIYYVITR